MEKSTRKKACYLSMRINDGLKNDFWHFCESVGVSVSAAVTMLARKCVLENRIPFDVISTENPIRSRPGQPAFSEERVSFRIDHDLRTQFSKVCAAQFGVAMSVVVKAFMVQCINTGRFPFDTATPTATRTVRFLD